jgi:hypothetical protein
MISLRTIIFFFLVLSGFSCYAQNSNKEDRLKALVKQNGQANISIFWPGKAAVRELPEKPVTQVSERRQTISGHYSPEY